MKTATFPSLRVEPELREAAEAVLQEGETLSSLIETAVRETVERRRMRAEFIARGLASRDALGARVLGQVVQVVERASDDHGRGIARLSLRGEDINRWLVQTGHAWAHRWRGRGPRPRWRIRKVQSPARAGSARRSRRRLRR